VPENDQDWYVEVPIETDEQTMADGAVERLQDQWEGWEPNEADLEVVQIEALAGIAAPVAQQASVATEEIFRAFGIKLVGVPFQEGTYAATTVTFTLIDTAPYTVPGGSEVDLDGVAFQTTDDASNLPGGSLISTVPVVCSVIGEAGNGLGVSASRISALAFVTDVTADAMSSGGVEPQSDADYLGYLSRKLQLRADTLVTKRDHEYWALDWPGVGRAYALTTADRHVTIYVATEAGEVVDSATKTAMLADMANYRLVNTITTLADPTYTVVNVTYIVHALPGYDTADLKLRANAMISDWLTPSGFAQPKFGDPGVQQGNWMGTNIVRKNSVIDRLGDVEGVDYIDSVTLSTPTAGATVDGNGNVVMTGTIALPRTGVLTGTTMAPGT
jgi:hypothetical protein